MPFVRRLSKVGVQQFVKFINEVRGVSRLETPTWLLYDEGYSEPLSLGDVRIEPRGFETRDDFARYIDQQILEAGATVDADEPGMWE